MSVTRLRAASSAATPSATACSSSPARTDGRGRVPLAGTHRGKASALAALGEATRRSSRQLVEIVDVLAGRELGALVAVERVGPEGQTTDIRRVLVYRVRDELLVECWLYDENQRLVDALWSG
jgi:hypothetical protein